MDHVATQHQLGNVQQSRLLQLPKELQLTIWEFVLLEPDPISFFETKAITEEIEQGKVSRRPSDPGKALKLKWYTPSLLQTCHACRVEGASILYSGNTFVLRHESTLSAYQQAFSLFKRHWQHLLLVTDFGIEYQLPSLTTFILHGRRVLVDDRYTFRFTSDASPSHQRPLTAQEASETDTCLCMIESTVKNRRFSSTIDCTDAMIAFLASFGEKMCKNELRVLRHCGQCGKKMVEQKPRQLEWIDVPIVSMPT